MNFKLLRKIKNAPRHWRLGGRDTSGGLEQNAIEFGLFCTWLEGHNINTFLEVGMAQGYLSRFLFKEMGIICDGVTIDGEAVRFIPNQLWIGDSVRMSKLVGDYDMIFIDGDHYQVEKDYNAYKGKCKYMAFHDILGFRDCLPVKEFWLKIKKQYKHWEFIDARHIDIAAGIGIIEL